MREFLFRGQTRRKGEKVRMDGSPVESNWVYGGVFQGQNFSVIYGYDPVEKHVVYSDTVGEYTGKKDIQGNLVFEGDVFKDDENECVGVVRWHNGAFKIFWYGHDGVMMPYGYDECAGKFGVVEVETFDDVYIDQMEVVGNIHDNPEFFMEA